MFHIVEQGEHLSGIALSYGLHDYRTIWEHPENLELRRKRKNPHVLYPGDRLFIPDRTLMNYPAATDRRHQFVRKKGFLRLGLRLQRGFGQPFSFTPCELRIGFDAHRLATEASGAIQHDISPMAQLAALVIHDTITVRQQHVPFDLELPLRIGHLDPVEETSGQVARLSNLGYYRSALSPVDQPEFRSAVEEFQCDQGLKVDGVCGPVTQARLKEAHGC